MVKIVGIRFRTAGKIYYFDPLDFELETAMHVIVETARLRWEQSSFRQKK